MTIAKGSAAASLPAPAKRRGRQRDAKTSTTILNATIDLLAEVGIHRLRVEDVANRAGVARGTIYLRWPLKEELVMDALTRAADATVPIPDTGSVKGDLVALALSSAHSLRATPLGRIFQLLIGEAALTPSYADRLVTLHAHRRRQSLEIVRRAIDRGELSEKTDADLLLDLVVGSVFERAVIARMPVTLKIAEAIVDKVLHGEGASAL